MTNRPRAKGTRGENEAVTWLRRWWGACERRALKGTLDTGDVAGTPLVVSVKRAESWPLHKWLKDLYAMRANATKEMNGIVHGFVMARRNHGSWVFFVPEDSMAHLLQKAYGKDASDV